LIRGCLATIRSGRRCTSPQGVRGENGDAESFFSRHRDGLLSVEEFVNPKEIRWFAGRRLEEYNNRRPHSSLGYGYLTPAEFATTCCKEEDGAARCGTGSVRFRFLSSIHTAEVRLPKPYSHNRWHTKWGHTSICAAPDRSASGDADNQLGGWPRGTIE